MFAIGSTIKLTRTYVNVSSNTALYSGGGLFLMENSKIYLMKTEEDKQQKPIKSVQLVVTGNTAVLLGGGIYIEDNNTSQCPGSSDNYKPGLVTAECFIQTLRLYLDFDLACDMKSMKNTFIVNNTASLGSALYTYIWEQEQCPLSATEGCPLFRGFFNT